MMRGMSGRWIGSRARVVGAAAAALGLVAAACSGDDGGGEQAGDVAGGGYEAEITRTDGGVPHIVGDSLEDVVFGQGYASGEDRACDLADQVIKIRGERALHLGPGEDDANVSSDVAWRQVGIFDRASQDWEDVGDEEAAIITAFTTGWNAHLEEVGADGLNGWCAGEDWVRELEPVELYAYGRSITLMASSAQLVGFMGSAQPPGTDGDGGDESASDEGAGEAAWAPAPEEMGSNGWAIGADRSATGSGMLVANPHFPWEGELRFWEVHLTVPGEVNAYGVQLSGLPGIGIGFNEHVGWTHTVSAGNRFTAYTLDLVEGDPTSYHYGDEVRELEPEDITVEVLGDDGEVEEVTRTVWSSHYGPVIDFPGFGWSEEATLSFRDANIDNKALFAQYLSMVQAESMDELIAAHEEHQGIPLFNTIATSADGRAWYADTSATPNLSDEAIASYQQALENDPIVSIARDSGAVLLDGSDPANEWVEAEGARSPGLVPFSEMPQVERDDYVFNANDSFWMPHATEMLAGDYSLLHGAQESIRSPRTRENAAVLDDTSAEGPAGDDGAFTLDELAAAAVQNRGYTSRALLDDVVNRCQGAGGADVELSEVPAEGDEPGLPAATIDIGPACDVLAGWDGVYDLDRSGPPLWRELMYSAGSDAIFDRGEGAGLLWAEPFDPQAAATTPAGLAPAPGDSPDPVLQWMARAVQKLDIAGFDPSVTLGEVQVAPRAGELVPIHGGTGTQDGVTNVVGWGGLRSTQDPAVDLAPEDVAPDSGLAELDDGSTGYFINNGTSFMMALEFTDEGPSAQVFLTYSNTEDREDPAYLEATERFSAKDWRTVLFDPDAVEEAATSTATVTG